MRILNISLDRTALDANSSLSSRFKMYGQLADRYMVVVPSREFTELTISDQVKIYGSGGNFKPAQLMRVFLQCRKLISKEKVDLISVQGAYYLGLAGLLLAQLFDVVLEIQIHGWESFFGLRKIVASYVLRRADSVRVVSQRLKRQLISLGVEERRITVVPIYVATDKKEAEKCLFAREKRNSGKFIFLTVGRLVPVKNIELQIQSLAKVLSATYINAELWIVGAGSEYKKLWRLAKEFGLDSRVKLLGRKNKSELDDLYRRADCFLLTSFSEGWGMVVIEAADHALPIIMTDVGCAGEFIKNGYNGVILESMDRWHLSEAMFKVATDENLRNRLAVSAVSSLADLLTLEQTLLQYKVSWDKALINENNF